MTEQIEKKYTNEMLKEMQSWDLDRKIATSLTRIAEFANHFNNQVCVLFSGGKDSTVLLDLVRKVVPDVPVVFSNTGLEYPEIQAFAREKGAEFVRPKMMFNEVITKYGYPIISKEVSHSVYYARKIINNIWDLKRGKLKTIRSRLDLLNKRPLETGKDFWEVVNKKTKKHNFEETHSIYNIKKYLPLAQNIPVLISAKCCSIIKKTPISNNNTTKKFYPFLGTLADESRLRKKAWLLHGCNAFDSKKITSQPLSFWTEQDILQYIIEKDIDICSVYGEIERLDNGKLHCTGCQRTGCVFCGYGAHLEKNGEERFLRLRDTHPKQYNYCINGGQWADNPYYDPEASTEPDEMGWVNWNPKKIWCPSKEGLGFGKVFDILNAEYGDDFIRYK